MSDYRLRPSDRLKSRKAIQLLFNSGDSVYSYPVRLQWILTDRDGTAPVRAGFSVPRKKFKKAADRNLLKRRMREAYRVHKTAVQTAGISDDKQVILMLIYTHDEILPFETIQKGIIKCLKKLAGSFHG